jgi:hypothetical protein
MNPGEAAVKLLVHATGCTQPTLKIMDIERNLESVYWESNRKQMNLVSRPTFNIQY